MVYRIRRTNITSDKEVYGEQKGDYSYLRLFSGTGRQYKFPANNVECVLCGDYVRSINFESIAAANRKLKTAAVKDIVEDYTDEETVWWEPSGHPYKLDIVEIELKHCNPMPGCKVSERVVKQIVPPPTVLDKLAVI